MNAAQTKLVEDHLHVARGCYRRFMTNVPPWFEDREVLLQACYEGLVKAAAGYDAGREGAASFVGYAWPRMWGSMQDELRKVDWLPRSLRIRIRRLEATVAKLQQKLDHEPTVDEICAAHRIDRDEYHELITARSHGHVVSLQYRPGGDGSSPDDLPEVIDFVVDAHDQFAQLDLRDSFRQGWRTLTDRERFVLVELVVNERSGLDVAAELGITESRVSQIRTGAAAKLRRLHRRAA